VRAPLAWLRAACAVAAGAALAACAASAPPPSGSAATRPARTGDPSASSAAPGSASPKPSRPGRKPSPATLTDSLSPAQLAGQRVIYSYNGLTPPQQLLTLISRGEVAGVIFFSGNITSEPQIAGVIATLDAADAAPTNPVRLPLLLMTDQEGGLVRRLPGAPDLSELQIGASPDPVATAESSGAAAAANLRGVGMNVNLAPVLDVFRTPGDFDDQFQRSYSQSPQVAAQVGAAFIRAQQAGGVAATAKHFPGLGAAATSQDTDVQPVTLHVPLARLRSIDELPYPAAISAGVKLVMVSWAVYPALDPSRPAGLSSVIVGDELRARLGFTGVTITDAIEAGALAPYGSIANRALLAAQAGMDLILCSAQSVAEGTDCAAGLQGGLSSGALSQPAFDAAASRVMALRASLPR
jgi:beta-N-acetylhexosaminidase